MIDKKYCAVALPVFKYNYFKKPEYFNYGNHFVFYNLSIQIWKLISSITDFNKVHHFYNPQEYMVCVWLLWKCLTHLKIQVFIGGFKQKRRHFKEKQKIKTKKN